MTERSLKLLADALAAIDAARDFMGDTPLSAYRENHMQRSAVERQLEILGEASAQLDKLDTAWRKAIPDLGVAIGLRNRIIHGYDQIDDDMVFETVQVDLPGMRQGFLVQLNASQSPPIDTS